MTDVVIAGAARTPIGSFGKSLASVPPSELGALAAKAAVERATLGPDAIDHVVFGNVIHTEPADGYMARVVGINAGIPKEVPAYTVNRLCGTGVQAIISGAQTIQTGEGEIVLAGGCESMSRAPFLVSSARWGARMGDAVMVDSVTGALTDPFESILMGVTAENVAERGSISRKRQDEFAVRSHRLAAEARREGKFDQQIVPVPTEVRGRIALFSQDEHIREDASTERLAALTPAFKRDGSVTAGNAAGLNDGGAAVVLMSRERAAAMGAPARARILSYASCGVAPEVMGIGPVPAVQRALKRAGCTLGDIDVVELNEAFAAQALAVIDELGLDETKVNPNGGAIALGHPLAATGAAITAKILDEMESRDLEMGLVTLCIGGGQGIALVLCRE